MIIVLKPTATKEEIEAMGPLHTDGVVREFHPFLSKPPAATSLKSKLQPDGSVFIYNNK